MPGMLIEIKERMIRYERSFRKFHTKLSATDLIE